jgi:hypothetical protein
MQDHGKMGSGPIDQRIHIALIELKHYFRLFR